MALMKHKARRRSLQRFLLASPLTSLKQIAAARGLSINDLITEIDKGRAGNLSSAIRLHVLGNLRNRLAAVTNGAQHSPAPIAPEGGA